MFIEVAHAIMWKKNSVTNWSFPDNFWKVGGSVQVPGASSTMKDLSRHDDPSFWELC